MRPGLGKKTEQKPESCGPSPCMNILPRHPPNQSSLYPSLKGRHRLYSHFTDEETEAQTSFVYDLPKYLNPKLRFLSPQESQSGLRGEHVASSEGVAGTSFTPEGNQPQFRGEETESREVKTGSIP